MMRSIYFYLKLTLVAVCITSIPAKPFLYNPSRALSLVVSSGSIPQQRSNIADLRRSKTQQLSKLQESQDEGDQSFFDESPVGGESTQNEAIPGIVQKKLAKIFAKIQLLSSFSNNNNYDSNRNSTSKTDEEPLDIFPVTTDKFDDNILPKGNSSVKEFEKLREFEEVTNSESAPPTRTGFMPITLSRILGAIVNLAYRMFSSPLNRGNTPKSE